MKKNVISIVYAILVLLLLTSLTSAAQTDSAGNVFITEDNPTIQTVERDLYWAGSSRTFNDYQIGKSLLAAGREITVSESTVGGSLRAGGFSVTLNGVDVTDNITAAGYSLQMSGVTASGVYLVGNTIYFNGTADYVCLAGNTVTLDGEINGDALIYAENVNLGKDLQVTGTLTIKSESNPEVPSDAQIESIKYTETETIDDIEDVVEQKTEQNAEQKAEPKVEQKAEQKAPKKKESDFASGFGKFIRGLFGTLLLAALICLLLGSEELSKPGEMLLSRPFPMLGSGFAGLFVIPGVILILIFTGIGLPSAGLLALLFTVVCIYSLIFAGMTLAKTLMPLFTYNKTLNNVWICSLIGAFVFWILRKIPVIGVILQFAAILYTLGYFIQTIYLRLKKNKTKRTRGTLAELRQNDVLEPVGKAEPETPAVPAEDDAAADVPEETPDAIEPEAETADIPAEDEAAADVPEEMPDAAEPEAEADTDPAEFSD